MLLLVYTKVQYNYASGYLKFATMMLIVIIIKVVMLCMKQPEKSLD